MSAVIEDGQEVRASWAAYFREIQEELAEVRAILDTVRTEIRMSKDANKRRSGR